MFPLAHIVNIKYKSRKISRIHKLTYYYTTHVRRYHKKDNQNHQNTF